MPLLQKVLYHISITMPDQIAPPPLILIVDDEPDFREIFGIKLRADGFRVDTAENGVEGVAEAICAALREKVPQAEGIIGKKEK